MFKQFKQVVRTLLVTGTIVALGATGVFAAGPVGTGPDTATAPLADWLSLAANGADWYAFTYDGGGEQVEVVVNVFPEYAVDVSIWTPDQIERGGDANAISPIGHATANAAAAGDLNWAGNFNLPGVYYVVVKHSGSQPGMAYYQLSIFGTGVGFPQAAADQDEASDMAQDDSADVATADVETADVETADVETADVETADMETADMETADVATADVATADMETADMETADVATADMETADAPAADVTANEGADRSGQVAVSETMATGASSDDALAIDGQWMPLETGRQYWFAFPYVGGNERVEIWLDVEPNEGASFSVWTPEQLQRLGQGEDIDPVGRGNSSNNTPGDLFWAGSFNEGGTYFVRVDHSGNNASYAALNIK